MSEAEDGGATQWAVVNTQPHREHVAVENLERQGYSAYLPRIRRRISHARRVQDVLRPLFPSYVFVDVEAVQGRWQPIQSTYGVRTLVRFGDKLGYVDSSLIAGLKAREVDGVIVRPDVVKPPQPYVVGERVQMNGGPFAGLVSTIIELGEKDRVVLLMELMQSRSRLVVRTDQIMPLAKHG